MHEVVLAQFFERLQEVWRVGERGKTLGEFGPVALGYAGDQGFLAVEVDVERAGADSRLPADVVHGRAVEPGAGKALLGSVQDVLATGALNVRLELGHLVSALRSHYVPAVDCLLLALAVHTLPKYPFSPHCSNKNERPFYLRAKRHGQGGNIAGV